jgi:hypothetical protein
MTSITHDSLRFSGCVLLVLCSLGNSRVYAGDQKEGVDSAQVNCLWLPGGEKNCPSPSPEPEENHTLRKAAPCASDSSVDCLVKHFEDEKKLDKQSFNRLLVRAISLAMDCNYPIEMQRLFRVISAANGDIDVLNFLVNATVEGMTRRPVCVLDGVF